MSHGLYRMTCAISGTVQGVGFRPAVYRLAQEAGLGGWIQNRSGRVVLQIVGPQRKKLRAFVRQLPDRAPRLARITAITVISEGPTETMEPFEVRASLAEPLEGVSIPPDVGCCANCLADVFDPGARRYGYPFTTCTDCGPRYTIVCGMPYDRARTTMAGFPLCKACRREYTSPTDRRFHAETLACPACGPHLQLLEANRPSPKGPPLSSGRALRVARAAIAAGKIVAVKGIGGFLLAADATNRKAIETLRARKKRPAKPFALAVMDVAAAKTICRVPRAAAELLASPAAPIVILDPVPSCGLPIAQIAPDTGTLGVMLPCSPLHALLLTPLIGDPTPAFTALIMTSGNRRAEPICLTTAEAVERLGDISDLILTHDRDITLRCDDSLVALHSTAKTDTVKPQIWRRARGYAPATLELPHALPYPTLAMGADLKNTIAIGWATHACLSPHLGDLETPEANAGQQKVLEEFPRFLGQEPQFVAVDLHPDMESTQRGERIAAALGLPILRVQHHHAHAAACLAEHGLSQGLALTFDGTGLGTDGTIWGAELLDIANGVFRRLGSFVPSPLPGGDAAVRQPARQLAARLRPLTSSRTRELLMARGASAQQLDTWNAQCASRLNAPRSRSAGRLFDAIACVLGIAPRTVSYEGQAAIQLEAAARKAYTRKTLSSALVMDADGMLTVDWTPTFAQLLDATDRETAADEWALAFHRALADAAVQLLQHGVDISPCRHVALSGGVFMNRLLTSLLVPRIHALGLTPLLHRHLPPNDGGIAFGQLAAHPLCDGQNARQHVGCRN